MRLGKNPTNKEIAQLLYFVAVAYEIKDKEKNRFKVIAYERAAQTIETLGEKVKGLWQTKKIKNLPGIGESITNHLSELFETGQVKHFQKIFKGFPPAMFEFTNIK